GQYTFDDFFHYLNNVFDKYLPSLRFSQFATTSTLMENRKFDYIINLKNTKTITELFLPVLKLDNKTRISGSFDSNTGMVKLNGSSPLIVYNGTAFVNWFIVGSTQSNYFKLNTGCSRIVLGDSTAPAIEQVSLLFKVQADSIAYNIGWNDFDKKDHNKADIKGTAAFSGYPAIMLKVDDARVMINDSTWTVNTGNYIRLDTSSVYVHDFQINGKNQGMRVNGAISENPLDKLTLTFDRFNISHLDLLLQNTGIDFDGFLNGSLIISGMYDVPNYIADLVVKNFCFNKEKLGDFTIKSSWDHSRDAIVLDCRIVYTGNAGTMETLLAKGFFYPKRKKDNFDIDATLLNYKISTLSPFFTGLFSNLKGLATGSLQLKGDLMAPVLLGSIKLMRTELKINYTNITYSFATEFNFKKDLMWFDNVTVYDSLGNSAKASGKIYHENFSKWRLDISVDAKRIAGLNTTKAQNELFYGDAFGTGNLEIKGPVDNLEINIDMRTEKGTNIYLPYSSTSSISQQNFIEFINRNDTMRAAAHNPDEYGGLTMNLSFDVTKDANIQFFLPNQMGNIKVRGDGKMYLGIDKNSDFTMRGKYTMDRGTFVFTLQKVFNRTFEIAKGSSITWSGDPYNADVDITALYKTKVYLNTIAALAGDPNMKKRTQVDCILKMKNSLMNPDIAFIFHLPNVDDQTRQAVYNAIDTTSVAEMNQQMISLLALNSFSFSTSNSNVANSLGASSFDLISSQISNQLSQISKGLDVGVKYSPRDNLSPEELEFALSRNFFNDRVTIDGSVATNNNATTTAATKANTSKLVGDFNVEYKITPDGQLRLKAFNRSNNNIDYLSNYAAYTQGVGIFYRREFDRFIDLFRKQRKLP
ncbi:MAG TPA: translocation/assembly module TamB domain-containing protein, partial [Bacteroidales bacterium]